MLYSCKERPKRDTAAEAEKGGLISDAADWAKAEPDKKKKKCFSRWTSSHRIDCSDQSLSMSSVPPITAPALVHSPAITRYSPTLVEFSAPSPPPSPSIRSALFRTTAPPWVEPANPENLNSSPGLQQAPQPAIPFRSSTALPCRIWREQLEELHQQQ